MALVAVLEELVSMVGGHDDKSLVKQTLVAKEFENSTYRVV